MSVGDGMTASPESGQRVLATRIMASIAHVALSIARFVSVEVVEGLCSAFWQRSVIAVTRVKSVVDVALEAMRAVEPGTGPDKSTADKPVRPVVAMRGAVIRWVIEIAVGADGNHTNTDSNLGRCGRSAAKQGRREN